MKIGFAIVLWIRTMTCPMAKKSKHRPGARAKGMTQISISLPVGLVSKIDAMADSENRNRSNFIANILQALATKAGV